MIEQYFGSVKADLCKDGCKSIWFDWLELGMLDEKNKGFGEALKEALDYPRVNDENRGQINCPKCGIPMHVHKYKASKEVNIDECYDCGGFFIDSGELKAIRDTYMNEDEQNAYAKKLIIEDPDAQEALKDLEKKRYRAEAINNWARFLRASYYLHGR